MIKIETHKFTSQDGTIVFDVAFDGLVYMNATQQYQKFDKSQTGFDSYKTRTLIPYAEKLIKLGKVTPQNAVTKDGQIVTVDDLIIVRKGSSMKFEQGTWLHPKLEIVFTRWLSDEFAIWCDEKIADLLANGMTTLEPEDRKWVDIVESLCDCKPGNAWFIGKVRDALLIHEAEGYHIRAFTDMMDIIRASVHKDDHEKTFTNIRQLIKDMYEDGELSRTSHEAMLELCVDTVIEVLKEKINRGKRHLRKLEFKLAEAPLIVATKTLKAEHDDAVKKSLSVIDTQNIYCHKVFGLALKPQTEELLVYRFGKQMSVADARFMIQEAGYRIALSNTLYPSRYDAKTGAPDLQCQESGTYNKVSIWFKENNVANCSIQTSYKEDGVWINRPLIYLRLLSNPSVDPAFYTGTNAENTVRVSLSTHSNFFMLYGRPSV